MAEADVAPVEEVAAPAEPQVVRTSPPPVVPAATTPEAKATPEVETPATEAPADDDGFGDFLKEVGIDHIPETTTSTPTDDQAAPDPRVMEAAEKLYQERITAAQERIASQNLAQTFDQTPSQIYHALIADGMNHDRAMQYYNTAVGLARAAETVLAPRTYNQLAKSLVDEGAKFLPKTQADKLVSSLVPGVTPSDIAKNIVESARHGYLSEKEATARATKAVVDKLKELDSQNLLVRNRRPSDGTGVGIATIGRMNFKTLGEAEAAHVAGQISNAQMRDIIAKGLPR